MPASSATFRPPELSVAGFTPDLRFVGHPPAGWIRLTGLAEPAARSNRHRVISEAAGPGAPARLPLAWEIEAVAWFVGVAVGGRALQRTARPDAGPEATWVRIGESGLAEGIALFAAARLALPTPRAARASITRLLAPVVESAAGRSSRVLWWHAGDRIADALLWCGEALAMPKAALDLTEEVLAPGVPYSVPLGVARVGEPRVRHTCCLSRRTAAGETCEGCPHRGNRRRAPLPTGP